MIDQVPVALLVGLPLGAVSRSISSPAVKAPHRLSLHSLRHGYASLLISRGLNVVFVSRQLGRANPNVTLEVYAHVFERADYAATAREALEASHAAMASSLGG